MRRLITAAAVLATLTLAGTAAAAIVPGTFADTAAHAACVKATAANGTLHLEKNCSTDTVASAFGTINDMNGQTFTSGSFTLASTAQCQGGSPRFNVFTTVKTYFLGCNNVKPVVNANGTATYTFTPATIAAGGNQVPFPTGTITGLSVLIDVQGTADVTRVFVNDRYEAPVPTTTGGGHHKHACPHGRDNGHDCGLHKGQHKHGDHNSQGQDNDDD